MDNTSAQTYYFSKPKIILTTLFLAANVTFFIIGIRIVSIFHLLEPGGILVFPFTFFFSDIITEVYGYKYARHLIWCVIIMLVFFTFWTWISLFLPSAVVNFDSEYRQIFSVYPKGLLATCTALFISFFLNNTILAKLKIRLHGKLFWIRSIMSTSIGHFTFSASVITIFWFGRGVGSWNMIKLIGCMYLWKMSFEIIVTPIAALTSSWLKRKEGVDIYDYDTKFNPFIL